jgi:2',3'-cyclic-nucleotide 2'-phosphodiesterase (5'-nucleotidase family)
LIAEVWMSYTRRRLIPFLAASVLFSPAAALAEIRLTVVHVNDTHSHLDGFGRRTWNLEPTRGGLARAATIIGEARATDPNVLFLHAGDVFLGDYFFNAYVGVPERLTSSPRRSGLDTRYA